jgi:prepilin-type N-terminal cleavage/methylation domain-containing protein
MRGRTVPDTATRGDSPENRTLFMENREHKHINQGIRRRHARPASADTAGFTLIEVMVVIFIMGVLAAAVISNWASFMRNQELRGDAINLHKEIMALKAKAIEHDDWAYIDAVVGGSACTLSWNYEKDGDPPTTELAKRVIPLKKDVIIDTDIGAIPAGSDLVILPGTPQEINYWMGANLVPAITNPPNNVRILINPTTLKENPVNAYLDGRIILKSSSAKIKARYCIQKDNTGIRPELYYQSKAGGKWTRM